MGILDVIAVLTDYKRFIFISMLAISIGAVTLALLLPQYYTATAVILPPKDSYSSGLGSMLGRLPVQGLLGSLDIVGSGNTDQFLAILDSRRLAERVIEKFDLIRRYKFHKRKKYYFESVLKEYHKNVRVSEDDLGTIAVSATDKSPKVAAEIANYILQVLNDINIEITQKNAASSRTFFENRLKQIEHELDSVQNAFAGFQTEHGYLDMQSQLSSTIEAITHLESTIMMLELEMEVLREEYGPESPRVKELEQRRRAMRRRINSFIKRGNGKIVLGLEEAPQLGVQYAELLRDVKVQEGLYELLIQMYEEAKFNEANDIPVVKVLETARVPDKRSRPKRSILCTLIFFAGLCATTALVLLHRWYLAHKTHETETYRKLQAIFSNFRSKK